MTRLALHWQIAIALALAAAVGAVSTPESPWTPALAFIGGLFLSALKMLVVPLIFASIINALLGLVDRGAATRLGFKTALYYVATSLLAILTGLLLVNLITPGVMDGEAVSERFGMTAEAGAVLEAVRERSGADIWGVFERMIPSNIVQAAAETDMLALIFFALLFGACCAKLPGRTGEVQRDFWAGVYQAMLELTHWVMKVAPIGVFALVADVVTRTGWSALAPLALFFLTVLLALAVHLLITLPLVLKLIGGVSPQAHYRAMAPALLTAFSTSSSAATLPLTIDCVQNRAGVSPQTTGFVLPLGATINMDGTALYECVVVMFIAQAYGIELTLATQFVIVWMALLTSIGVAGIPAASLVAIAVILGAVGLPLEGIGLILAVDRILDMCRTAVNVFGDSTGAVVIARHEGEDGILGVPARGSAT
jgi:proton glutamate symport protein